MKYVAELLPFGWFKDGTEGATPFGPGEDFTLHSVIKTVDGRQIAIWAHHGELERLGAELRQSESQGQWTRAALQDQRMRVLRELLDAARILKSEQALLRANDDTAAALAHSVTSILSGALERALRVINERPEASVTD